uniref:Ionotropic glutamate receptor C-terminal domain-containing protein n=1 Tax=Scylla olivacea TaxID=85551 RepID=A0A0P4VWB0_SCYOL
MLLKVFVTCWYAFCFVLISAYTTNLVAILTKPAHPPLPRTLHQLAASHYRYSSAARRRHTPAAFLAIWLTSSHFTVSPFYYSLIPFKAGNGELRVRAAGTPEEF